MGRRSYNEFCGLSQALDMVGERWTLLVVRNLLLGPLRYSDLLRGLPGITTNLLAKRLREMESNGLVERIRHSAADGGQAYRLTALGCSLEPAVHALGRFGWNWMQRPPREGEHRSLEWLMVALRRRYRGGESLRVEVVADDVPYRFVLSPKRVEIARGPLQDADLRLRAPAMQFARLFLQGIEADDVAAGVAVEGDASVWRRFFEAFERGDPVVQRMEGLTVDAAG